MAHNAIDHANRRLGRRPDLELACEATGEVAAQQPTGRAREQKPPEETSDADRRGPVETERASRYLVQLCQHVDKLGRARPQMQAHAEWSDDRGVISFGWGRCTLRALPGVLTLSAEAPDEDALRRVEYPIGARLVGIGRRDHLTVTWTPPRDAGEKTAKTPADATEHARGGARD